MPYLPLLKKLLEQVDGAVGAGFADYDGETVQLAGQFEDFEHRVHLACQGILLETCEEDPSNPFVSSRDGYLQIPEVHAVDQATQGWLLPGTNTGPCKAAFKCHPMSGRHRQSPAAGHVKSFPTKRRNRHIPHPARPRGRWR